eukprot:1790044-Pyramimonas_sp.AAC.1
MLALNSASSALEKGIGLVPPGMRATISSSDDWPFGGKAAALALKSADRLWLSTSSRHSA